MMSTTFDLQNVSEDYLVDPYRVLAELRAQSPVHKNTDGTFVLTCYADIVQTYRDPMIWSSDKRATFKPKFGNTPLFEHHTNSIVFIDPPNHTRIRRLFQSAFTRKALAAFVPRITSLVDEYLNRLEDQGQMEVVEEFSFRLPIEVVCDLLGVPRQDREFIRGWANAILTALEPTLVQKQLDDGNQAVVDFKQYLGDLIAYRRAHPHDAQDTEVLTILADAEADGKRLTEIELLHQCIFMLNAGHETSTNMITHGIHEMLLNPDQIDLLSENPDLIEPMVEEVLRYQAPIQINNRRANSDQILSGVTIPADTTVHMMINAANRDPAQFSNPDRFDITRRPNRHLSFGLGVHICAGNALARVEAQIAFQRLFRRFPKLALTIPAVIAPRLRFREVSSLHVSVT
ncbi:MAG TPA: cytochrome P450 [Porticoccaceae bacterium]|jgi:cytochrome P450|nr:cytochrome P450 [Tateyamaria sp.]HAZ80270.1 cytochrome P450 [Porticoccaceae bacterium]